MILVITRFFNISDQINFKYKRTANQKKINFSGAVHAENLKCFINQTKFYMIYIKYFVFCKKFLKCCANTDVERFEIKNQTSFKIFVDKVCNFYVRFKDSYVGITITLFFNKYFLINSKSLNAVFNLMTVRKAALLHNNMKKYNKKP